MIAYPPTVENDRLLPPQWKSAALDPDEGNDRKVFVDNNKRIGYAEFIKKHGA